MRITARIVAVALCAALALSVAGCGDSKRAKLSVAADPSVKGTVTVYTSLPQEKADAYLASFKTQYPNVKLKVVPGTPTTIVNKIIKEKKAPVADVIWHTPLSSVKRAIEASAIAPYAYHPGQIDALGGDFVDGETPSNPMWVGTDIQLIAFAVNSGKTGGNSPAGFPNLAETKYSGQLALPSINTDAGYAMVSGLMVYEDEQTVWDQLDKVDKNVAFYSDDEAAPVKAAADGSVGVGVGWDSAVVGAQNDGNAVDAVFPGVPQMSPWEIDADALVSKPNRSPAAKVFLDWAISDPAMAAYAKDTPVTGVDTGAGLPSGYPSVVSDQLTQPADFAWTSENHDRIVKEWMKRYGKKIQAAQ